MVKRHSKLAAVLLFLVLLSVAHGDPVVKCVLVIPPRTAPYPDGREKLTRILKDLQWWYSCQMEGHGYGPKTFALETDKEGLVRIHIAQLAQIPRDPRSLRQACTHAASRVLGQPWSARNRRAKQVVALVVYGDYIWTDPLRFRVEPHGRGLRGRWGFITAWHYHSAEPEIWKNNSPLEQFDNPKHTLPRLHAKVLDAFFTSKRMRSRSIGLVACG